MKRNIIIAIFAIGTIFCQLYAQTDKEKFSALESEGSVKIFNENVFANCASLFQSVVRIDNNRTIVITQTDTIREKANCMCLYDFDYKISELKAGQYTIKLYREFLREYGYDNDTVYLAGTATVEVTAGFPMPPILFTALQSPCDPNKIEDDIEFQTGTDVFPNPATGIVEFSYTLKKPSMVTIDLLDNSGKNVMSLQKSKIQWAENYKINIDTSELASGKYYIRIALGGRAYTSVLIVEK